MNKDGFTLIEFLIYSTIVVFVIGSLTMMGVNVMYGRVHTAAMRDVNKNARFSMSRMTSLIREAESAEVLSGGDLLSLTFSDPEENPTEVYVDEGVLQLVRGGGDPVDLTDEKVVVSIVFSQPEADLILIEAVFEFFNPAEMEEYEIIKSFRTLENIRK